MYGVYHPASLIVPSRMLLLSKVFLKILNVLKCFVVGNTESKFIHFVFEDYTLARKILGKRSRCGVSLSLALSPSCLPCDCLRSYVAYEHFCLAGDSLLSSMI